MPLKHSKSKAAFVANLKEEMKSGKPQNQALGIAYSVKRKAAHKHKMAEGGAISAKSEKRPMPEDKHNDHEDVALNSSRKPSHNDSWSGRPTVKQAQKPSLTRLSQPKMVESGVIRAKLRSDEHDLMDKAPPESDKAQPSKAYDEHEAKKKGPDSKDLHMKMMAKGGNVEKGVHAPHKGGWFGDSEGESRAGGAARWSKEPHPGASASHGSKENAQDFMKRQAKKEHSKVLNEMRSMPDPKLKGLAEGGMLDLEDKDRDAQKHHSAVDDEYGGSAEADEAPEDSPLDGLDDEETQPVDEFMAGHFAEGGHIEESEDNYADDGDHDSIAAAIMSRRDKLHDEIDSGAHDEDLAAAYAEGGEVDLSQNADEEPNNEDQMSFEALKKENYSESDGLDELGDQPEDSNEEGDKREDERSDKHDRVSAIMSKMKSKSKR